jgi:hypothetical protein
MEGPLSGLYTKPHGYRGEDTGTPVVPELTAQEPHSLSARNFESQGRHYWQIDYIGKRGMRDTICSKHFGTPSTKSHQ